MAKVTWGSYGPDFPEPNTGKYSVMLGPNLNRDGGKRSPEKEKAAPDSATQTLEAAVSSLVKRGIPESVARKQLEDALGF